MDTRTRKGTPSVPSLHADSQDEAAPGWLRLRELIRIAARRRSTIFEPAAQMPCEDWLAMRTLPSETRELRQVKELRLYGSPLQRLPPEIGRMSSLKNLDIYTSYSLHWLPYELVRCRRLSETRMSTRALYGNKNTRLPFPRLSAVRPELAPDTCSVCDRPFAGVTPQLFWTTQRVGTDNAPLLIHSCSVECTASVPDAPAGYHPRPHKGGGGVGMPVE